MHKKYDHEEIERRWKTAWQESKIYDFDASDTTREKEYILVEWPYPSGNLHIGHWHAFSVADIYVRSRRMMGKNVLFPIGFDAFGLPAENAAIKNDTNPREWTLSNTAHMRDQLDQMGNSFSWNMTTSSTDPSYYKWTQWMFTEFFKAGIAYRGKGMVNWCPGCHTVIANEQVLSNNTCERSGHLIEKREMPQWMLRITDYADRLIDDLDNLPWPESIKEAQKRWIGRSNGARITFNISAQSTEQKLKEPLVRAFTTRPETLYGVSFIALAPEHPLVRDLIDNDLLHNTEAVLSYLVTSSQKNDIERQNIEREKTGVRLEGVNAVHPITKESIPLFVADYVLGGYGTGAVMGVPGHDERDRAFAQVYELPIKEVINDDGFLINSMEESGLSIEEAKLRILKKSEAELSSTYRLRDWSVGRQRYWGVPVPIVYDPEGNAHPIPEEHLPWLLPEDVDFRPTGVPPLTKSNELKKRVVDIWGEGWTPEVETMDTFVDSSWYFLRYIDNRNDKEFSSKQRQKGFMPVDLYFGGAEHTTMHLLYSRFWQKALYDLGHVIHDEPYRMRINRGLILGPDGHKMSKSKGNVVDPDNEVRRFGADTVKMYLAFLGPYAETANYPFDMDGIVGIRRFLERVYGLNEEVRTEESTVTTQLLHKTIKKVTGDITQFKFNTAISAMMIFLNHAEKEGISSQSYQTYLKLLAPFAPFLTEELWHSSGNETSIHQAAYPTFEESLIVDLMAHVVVQVNGKTRGSVDVNSDATEEEVMSIIKDTSKISSYLLGEVTRVIYKKGKIINIVVKNENT